MKKLLHSSIILFGILFIVVLLYLIHTAYKNSDSYHGGYSPDGVYCEYGYNYQTKVCCDEDDYSCEIRDKTCDDPLVKGNISSGGEKIYHVPGGRYYEQTVINTSSGERWFCTENEAIRAGWRKSIDIN